MGFFDWILKGVGVEAEDDESDIVNSKAQNVQNAKDIKKQEKIEKKKMKKEKRNKKDMNYQEENNYSQTSFASNPDQFNTNNTYYNAYEKPTSSNVGGYGSKSVVIYYPKNYEEVQNLIDYLKQGESAVMNLDGVSDIEAQRILDFVSGAVYALSGSIHRITGNIFMLTPEGYNIMVPKKQ